MEIYTLLEFRPKTNIVEFNPRLVWLARMGRQLSARVLVAELTGDTQIDALLRAKDRLNRLLARELKYLNRN